jgi:glycosyltransferase involved in cell wall biosynthesis
MPGLGHIRRGAERWARDLAYGLLKHNIDVVLFKGGGIKESQIEHVVPCIKRNSAILGGKESRIPWVKRIKIENASFAFFLLPYILFDDFDIWHVSSLPFPLRHLKSKGLINQKLIRTCHGYVDPQTFPNWLDAITQPAPFYIENAQKANVDTKKWFLLPNFVDTNRFNPEVKSIRNKLGIPDDSFVVLSVGAITHRFKRMDHLIREFSKISKKENVFLLIVGEEEDETPWIKSLGRKLGGNRIKFLSNIPFEEMPQLYASSDIFVLASLNELDEFFGIVFLEAMSSGKPVIGMAHPVTKWIVGEGGENIDMSIEGNIAITLRKYITDTSLREEKGRLARIRVQELFSLDKAVEKTIDIYKHVLEN